MSFFNPLEAPKVHLEFLPDSTIAVEARLMQDLENRLRITSWNPSSKTIPAYSYGLDSDTFYNEYCDDCRFNTEEMEYEADGNHDIITRNGFDLLILGTVYTRSPCPCYDNGVSSVDFPCEEGHDGPTDGELEDTLPTKAMAYAHEFRANPHGYLEAREGFAFQQRLEYDDQGRCLVGSLYRAINTFSPRDNICWGENNPGNSLLEIEDIYVTSDANEDLSSFSTHTSNCYRAVDNDATEIRPYAVPVLSLDNLENANRPKALICATALNNAPSFVLLSASGAHTSNGVAYIPVYLYKGVKVDGTVFDEVWCSEPTNLDKRLLFCSLPAAEAYENKGVNAVYLGQVDKDFNLTSSENTTALQAV